MTQVKWVSALALVAMLGACEAKIGKHADEPEGNATAATAGQVSAEGKSKEGEFSIKAPGFDMKVDIPTGLANRAEIDNGDIIYPDSTLSGMHVEARDHKGADHDKSAVELRFTNADAPETIAAWYRDSARAKHFSVASAARQGTTYVIEGVEADDGDAFKVYLSPRAGGGTDGRLVLDDRS